MTRRSGRLGIGVIGCGRIATSVHLPLLSRLPGVRVVALADPDERALAAVGARLPRAARYADHRLLLRRGDVAAVVVAAPTGLHGSIAIDVLEAGRHLYLEKPVAASVAEGRRVAALGASARVVACAGFNRRFHPAVERLRELLRAGALGEVRAVSGAFHEPLEAGGLPAWRRRRALGGGVLLDLVSHHVDLIRFLLGEELAVEGARVASRASEGDAAELAGRLGSGASLRLEASYGGGREDRIVLEGERGTLALDRHACTIEASGRRVRSGLALSLARLRVRVRPGADPSYARSLLAFVAGVRGRGAELATLEDGLRALEAVAAAEALAAPELEAS